MFDREIATILRTGHAPDRIAYTCSGCHAVTYAPPGCTAIVCGHCQHVDLGTELARNRWRTVAEIRLADRPETAPKPGLIHPADLAALLVGFAALLSVLA